MFHKIKKVGDLEDLIKRKEPEDQTWFSKKWEDIEYEVQWQYRDKILSPWNSLWRGIDNLRIYRKIIWNDRFWDHTFLLELILFKLKTMEEHWGKDTHYVNDTDEKETLQKLIEDLEWMLDPDVDDYTKEGIAEYKKRSRAFFGRLDRNHLKFWD